MGTKLETPTTQEITTLVPAFKVAFFGRLLGSLARQLGRPGRIMISDDTESGDFRRALLTSSELRNRVSDLRVEIVSGPRKGYHANVRFLLSNYSQRPTPFFHFHLDDDELLPSFYQDHVVAHAKRNTLCCVSRRIIRREGSNRGGVPPLPVPLEDVAKGLKQVHLEDLIETLLRRNEPNWLGELSCCTIRRSFLDQEPDFNMLAGVGLEGVNDTGTLVKCCMEAPILLLTEPLGVFSLNRESISGKRGYFYCLSILAKGALGIALRRSGKVEKEDVLVALRHAAEHCREEYGESKVASKIQSLINRASADYEGAEEGYLRLLDTFKGFTPQSSSISTKEETKNFLSAPHWSKLD